MVRGDDEVHRPIHSGICPPLCNSAIEGNSLGAIADGTDLSAEPTFVKRVIKLV